MREGAVLDALRRVARRLDVVREEMVFLGGAFVPVLLTDPGASEPRPTLDVDVVVEVTTRLQYHEFTERLRPHGFSNDTSEGAPLCRWLSADDKLDVMPQRGDIIGEMNSWYPVVLATSWRFELAPGLQIRGANPPAWIATKVEAFRNRGGNDFQASQDMMDLMTVVDGRDELALEIEQADARLCQYIRDAFADWLASSDFLDALPGHLPGDVASQQRLPALHDRLRRIARQ